MRLHNTPPDLTLVENKRKSAIVEQLVKHNFKPDPVKTWREEQRLKELKKRGDAILEEEEEEEEPEDEAGGVTQHAPVKESAAEQALNKKVSDYDYLVGMAMWKLSTEDKDKLLAESEAKKTELRVLRSKKWNDLWEEDLGAFLIALDKQEKKEQADIDEVLKLAAKRLASDKTGKGKAASKVLAQNMEDLKPNPNATKIEPDISGAKSKYAAKSTARSKKGDDADTVVEEDGEESGETHTEAKKTRTRSTKTAKPAAKRAPVKKSAAKSTTKVKDDEGEERKPVLPPSKRAASTRTAAIAANTVVKKQKRGAADDDSFLADDDEEDVEEDETYEDSEDDEEESD